MKRKESGIAHAANLSQELKLCRGTNATMIVIGRMKREKKKRGLVALKDI